MIKEKSKIEFTLEENGDIGVSKQSWLLRDLRKSVDFDQGTRDESIVKVFAQDECWTADSAAVSCP